MTPQVVIAADARTADEGLRRRLDAMLGLEGVGFGARRQPMVVDREAAIFQQVLCLEPIGADVVGHDHAIEGGVSYLFRHAAHIASVRSEEHTSELQSLM